MNLNREDLTLTDDNRTYVTEASAIGLPPGAAWPTFVTVGGVGTLRYDLKEAIEDGEGAIYRNILGDRVVVFND